MSVVSYKSPPLSSDILKAQKIYEGLGEDFAKENNGKYISVEPNSGDSFVAETREEAVEKANAKYKDKLVFTRRIGILEKISFYSPTYLDKSAYACVF